MADEAVEAWIITLVELCRQILNEDFAPVSISFKHSKDVSIEPYETYFRAPVKFAGENLRSS